MQLNIKLENFEGPFDLLLHLIKKNKMSICDIKIFDITSQYLEYLKAMEEMDLEITSEFILIAATLLEIKSKALLPKSSEDTNEDDSLAADKLIEKLTEYKKFKMAAGYLKERFATTGMLYSKEPEAIKSGKKIFEPYEFLKNVTMAELYNIYAQMIALRNEKFGDREIFKNEIHIEKFRIEEKMEYIMNELKDKESLRFSHIASCCKSKIEAIVSFLAILELMRLKMLKAYQESNFSDIYLMEETDG